MPVHQLHLIQLFSHPKQCESCFSLSGWSRTFFINNLKDTALGECHPAHMQLLLSFYVILTHSWIYFFFKWPSGKEKKKKKERPRKRINSERDSLHRKWHDFSTKAQYSANTVKCIPLFHYKLNATMTRASYCQKRASHFQNKVQNLSDHL